MKLLRLFPSTPGHFDWALSENGRLLGSGESLPAPAFDESELIIPAGKVLLTRCKLPRAGKKRLVAMAAFALEEQLIADPEKNHIAFGATDSDGSTSLAAIDAEWLKKTLQTLAAAGIRPARALPEMLLPAVADNAWHLSWKADGGFLRTGEYSGLALDAHSLEPPLALKLALAENPPERIEFQPCAQGPDFAKWSASLGMPMQAGEKFDAKTSPASCRLDLLQGAFSSSGEKFDWQPTMAALSMLALALALQFFANIYQWAHLAGERKQLNREMENIFRQTFPEANAVTDAPLQMQRKLDELRQATGADAAGDFLPLLSPLSKELGALPHNSLKSMEYSAQKLDFTVAQPSNDAARQLQSRLQSSHLRIDLLKTETTDKGVLITLRASAS